MKFGGKSMLKRKLTKVTMMLAMVLIMAIGMGLAAYAEETEVLQVVIDEIPAFEQNGVIADAQIGFQVPEGYKAVTQWKVWDEETEDYKVVTEGTFTETDVYELSLLIEAEDGYVLPEEIEIDCVDDAYDGCSYNYDDDNQLESYSIEIGYYTFTTQIWKVDISIPKVEAGKEASVEKVSVLVYTEDDFLDENQMEFEGKWINELTGEDVTGEIFEKENSYKFDATMRLKEGYSFAKDVEININGTAIIGITDPCHTHFFPSFPLFTPVEHVHINNLPSVKAGGKLSTDFTMECHCENCDVSMHWHDEEENEITEENFVLGKTYILCLHYEGYYGVTLTDDFVFIIDGKEYKPTEIEAENGRAILELKFVAQEEKEQTTTSTTKPTAKNTENTVQIVAPNTGDSSMTIVYVLMAMVSFAVVTILYRKRRVHS